MINFFKGIIIGIGGIAPGLSGSILLVIFGLYEKTINAIGTLFKDFKKNVLFLIPLFAGFGVGILLFSKVVDFLLLNFETYTRFTFLGLIMGTIPLFYKEVKKEGFNNKYYIYMVVAFIVGIILFFFNNNLFPTVTNPNLLQSVLLGVAIAGSSIIPGVDSAAILSALGLYEIYVSSVATLNIPVLIPAVFGLGIGALLISFFMNKLIKNYYTATFSVIFGLFISIVPSVLNESCYLGFNFKSVIALLFVVIGFAISFFFGKMNKDSKIVKKISELMCKIKLSKRQEKAK